MPIYRAVPLKSFVNNALKTAYPGKRLSSNIAYLVDNLWEFARPDSMPSRRHAVYASPTPELAIENARAPGTSVSDYVACAIVFERPAPMIQLSVTDARLHRDVGNLQRSVNSLLAAWVDTDVSNKLAVAPLFLPGITKDDFAMAMNGSGELESIVL